MSKIILCGKKVGCCPTIEKVGEEYHIEDDYSNRVIMTDSQLKELVDKYECGEIY